MSNMRQFGIAHQTYASDNRSFIAALTGAEERASLPALTGWQHCALQAQKLIRNADDRGPTSTTPVPALIDGNQNAMVFEQFSYLPLVSYLGEKMRLETFVCPEDRCGWRGSASRLR